ncbi:MAG: inositol monophosphatase [Deltaproteobacteria bacterium]|nr:inositol monophosphatase [Deltaproteobacteria bacterium]
MLDQNIIETGLQAVKTGGAIIKNHFGQPVTVTYKGKLDLVTEIDHRCENAIIDTLQRNFPDHGILAEERSELTTASAYRWILDPLDGTTNFAHGYPCFCVSLALEVNGCVAWGAVYDPILGELFTAEQGRGAFCNGNPIRVSATDRLVRAMLCTGFPYDVHDSAENNLDYFLRFIKSARAVRRDGSAALDLCYVAMGRFDGFWELKLKPWDVAAGALIAAEAGAAVSGFTGNPFTMDSGKILATNALIHSEMLEVLSGDAQ